MERIGSEEQYIAAIARLEELLKTVDDDTPDDDPRSVELMQLADIIGDYEDLHYDIGGVSMEDLARVRACDAGLTDEGLRRLLGERKKDQGL